MSYLSVLDQRCIRHATMAVELVGLELPVVPAKPNTHKEITQRVSHKVNRSVGRKARTSVDEKHVVRLHVMLRPHSNLSTTARCGGLHNSLYKKQIDTARNERYCCRRHTTFLPLQNCVAVYVDYLARCLNYPTTLCHQQETLTHMYSRVAIYVLEHSLPFS